jgi:GalNAc-alpha-(1->4)-GalNAc-alpha-(1->3)-diNAcBac-PP-undecaprenol alpha-1,4-N-acetyl-D-galactosaminyltransferase
LPEFLLDYFIPELIEMRKVLFLTGSIKQGGAEFQILAFAKLLKENGFDVKVVALTDYTYYLSYIEENRISYTSIKEGGKIQKLLAASGIIHDYSPEYVVSYIRRTSIVAIVIRILNLFRFKLIISERTSLKIPLYDLFYFNFALLANKITVNSTSKFDYIRHCFPLLRNRLYFLPNIINIGRFAALIRNKTHDGVFKVYYVGRISREKNLLNLLRAIFELSQKNVPVCLRLVGECNDPTYLEEIMSLVKELTLNDIVDISSPADNVNTIYSKADLLCLVSFYEGFSNVLCEAMCSGLAVIASSIEENKYLVEDGENGFLVNPYDFNEIATAIEKFLKLDPAEKVLMSQRNRDKIIRKLNPSEISQAYLSLFK